MQWLIALVVISLLLAPVMWMMPSKSQKRQGLLRQLAREAGLQVQLCPMPQSRRQQVRQEDTRMGACYTLLVPRNKHWQRPFYYAWRFAPADESRFSGETTPELEGYLNSLFDVLPADVVALESRQQGLAVYWQERGDSHSVQAIATALRELLSWMESPK